MNLLELLQNGKVEEFNAARDSERTLEFFAAELSEAKLSGADLSGVNLDKSDMTEADLSETTLNRVSMVGIDGEGINFTGAFGLRARLKEAWLEGSKFDQVDLSRGDLTEAVLNKTTAAGAVFAGARMKGAEAKEVKWAGASLTEANIKQVDFTDADLAGCDMREARAANAIFVNAKLDGVVGHSASFQTANLTNASFVGADLTGANLSGADLTGADFDGANLTGADFTNAIVKGARFNGATLANACLDGVDLSGTELEAADLTGIDTSGLGLSDHQTEGLAASGWVYDPDAPLCFVEPSAGRNGNAVAVLWVNLDTPETASVRWVLHNKGKTYGGVLPVAPDTVVVRSVLAVKDGFSLVLVQERANGHAAVRYPLSLKGERGAAKVTPLGYEPGVVPVLRSEGGKVWMWGLARRGPTLVIHRDEEEGFQVVHSKPLSTARGFLGRYHPVMACKGGVVVAYDGTRAGPPMRTPDGFPSRVSATVLDGDEVVAVWAVDKAPRRPAGLLYARLGKRGGSDPSYLIEDTSVSTVDAWTDGGDVLVAWSEIAGDVALGPARLGVMSLPEARPRYLDVDLDVEELRFVDGPGSSPMLMVVTIEETIVFVNTKGKELVRLGG